MIDQPRIFIAPDISCIKKALEDKDRTVLGQTAPPEGLFLMDVNYKK